MSNKPLDRSKDRLVKISLEIPTYGTPEQAVQTAERAVKLNAVTFQTELTGKYKGHSFTYTAKGKKVLFDEDGNRIPEEPYIPLKTSEESQTNE